MVKALSFKGDKKPSKKRKRTENERDDSKTAKQASAPPAPEADEDENWVSADAVSDTRGPVMLVLPGKPASCLATDAMGKVHASTVENMVEDEAYTAEPHLVSQVWIATRIVGSEDKFSFKGHHGRFLGCDKYGFFSATREAISPEETFTLVPAEGAAGLFDIETGRKQFLLADRSKGSLEVRGDASEPSDDTHVRIRMQARFKPKHQVEQAEKVRAKISRAEIEKEVGQRLDDEQIKILKRARREGNYHEALLDVKVKVKHDKYS